MNGKCCENNKPAWRHSNWKNGAAVNGVVIEGLWGVNSGADTKRRAKENIRGGENSKFKGPKSRMDLEGPCLFIFI